MHKKLTAAQIQARMASADSWMRVVDSSIKIRVENRNIVGETIVKVFVKRTDECLKNVLTMNGGNASALYFYSELSCLCYSILYIYTLNTRFLKVLHKPIQNGGKIAKL